MERVLTRPSVARLLNRRRSPSPAVAASAILMPGGAVDEWEFYRPAATADGQPTRQMFSSLDAAASSVLTPGQPFTLELPLEVGLIQRLSLPPAEPSELEEMARIQLEKILPYSTDAMETAFQVIERRESETIVAVAAVPHDRLLAICQPLTSRGHWPLKVTFHAWSIAVSAPEGETSAMVYRAAGKIIFGICENGQLSFARSLGGGNISPEEFSIELPTLLLGAELEGVPVSFASARLDGDCADLSAALEDTLGVPVNLFRPEPSVDSGQTGSNGDLSPPSWRAERLRSARAALLRHRLLVGVAIYAGLMLIAFLLLGVMKFQVSRLDARLRAEGPNQEFVRSMEGKWKVLAPATQPAYSLAEALFQVNECLPQDHSVLLTYFEMTPTALTVRGEAPSTAAAVAVTELIRARPELKMYVFKPLPPAILHNGRGSFSVTGELK